MECILGIAFRATFLKYSFFHHSYANKLSMAPYYIQNKAQMLKRYIRTLNYVGLPNFPVFFPTKIFPTPIPHFPADQFNKYLRHFFLL